MMHRHECGRTRVGVLPGFGCGHVWEHDGPMSVDGSFAVMFTSIMRDHMCPKCGKGPWYCESERPLNEPKT